MSKQQKRLESLRSNPRAVWFEDACKIAERLGFSPHGGKGSHRTYGRLDEPLLLSFQIRGGYILPYQARQLLAMVERQKSGSGLSFCLGFWVKGVNLNVEHRKEAVCNLI